MRGTQDERFWLKVAGRETDGCWLWTGALLANGYGMFRASKSMAAHRWAYEHVVGPIPEGLQLDHLCRVRNCVNPSHLEPVTQAENIRRGFKARGHSLRRSGYKPKPKPPDYVHVPMADRTQCPQGHPYDDANTYLVRRRNGRTDRTCRACRKASSAARYQRRKANA